jgi:hypothetical protein
VEEGGVKGKRKEKREKRKEKEERRKKKFMWSERSNGKG